ncbi:MAG TPA: hypothetical protein VD996_13740 [Chitinophagaceae bacterium]|nr:hypothetical protein [Chitinophagaceae bacterium]
MSTPPFTPVEVVDIQGLDLKADPAIQQICDASNATSNSTRSVLYVLVLVNVLALITVLNSINWNWTDARIHHAKKTIDTLRQKELAATDETDKKRYQDSISVHSEVLKLHERSNVENYINIRVPIIGNAFDVNNLGIVAGVSFTILLFILRFTLGREIANLRLALNAITKRYPNNANERDFAGAVPERELPHLLPSINYTRRLHHYNSLSMNEIFTLPPLEITPNRIQKKFIGWLIMRIYYLPLITHLFIVLNDISTLRRGLDKSTEATLLSLIVGVLALCVILALSVKCTRLQLKMQRLYEDFKNCQYRYIS